MAITVLICSFDFPCSNIYSIILHAIEFTIVKYCLINNINTQQLKVIFGFEAPTRTHKMLTSTWM